MPSDSLEEYRDASANMRHYSNLRFAQLTIFFAVTGGLILGVTQGSESLDRDALRFAGLVVVLAFWVLEQRILNYWEVHRRRAKELEPPLGFKQYSYREKHNILDHLISGRWATRVLFAGAIVFWSASLFADL